MRIFVFWIVATTTVTTALTSNSPNNQQRRSFLNTSVVAIVGFTGATAISQPSIALDMDAFMNNELAKDSKKEEVKPVNDDATTCRVGAPGKETGDACVRAGLPTTRKTGVDAYGNLDRGDFIRCTTSYKIENDKYMRIVTCQDKNISYIKDKCVAKGAGCI